MRLFTFFGSILLLSFSAGILHAQKTMSGVAEDFRLLVEPGEPYADVLFRELGGNRITNQNVTLVDQPVHGGVDVMTDRFRYYPAEGLFSLRSDNFTYELTTLQGTSSAAVIVSLRTDDLVLGALDFEGGPNGGFGGFSKTDPTIGTLAINRGSAMEGLFGLRASTEAQGAQALLELKKDDGGDPHEPGRIKVLGCDFENIQQRVAILAAGPSQLDENPPPPNVRAVLQRSTSGLTQSGGSIEIVVEMRDANGSWTTSSGIAISHQIHHLDFDWWPSTEGHADGGVILRIDGQALVVEGIDTTDLDLSSAQVGVMPVDGPATSDIGFDYDQLVIFAQGETERESELFRENFESRPASVWSTGHGSSMRRVKKNILNGDYAIEGNLGEGTGFRVAELNGEEHEVHLRFKIDAAGIHLGPGDIFRLVDFGSDPNALYGPPHASLRVQALGGVPHLAFHSVNPGGYTAWVPMTRQHWVDLHWVSSKGSGPMANGYIRLWIDGRMVGVRRHLDIDRESVNWVRFGIMGVDPGTQGEVYFDDLLVWR